MFALQRQAPVGQRAQSRQQPQAHQQQIDWQALRAALGGEQLQGRQACIRAFGGADLANGHLHAPGAAQGLQPYQVLGWGIKNIAPVLQRQAGWRLRCVGAVQHLGHGGRVTAMHHDMLTGELRRCALPIPVVEQLCANQGIQAGHLERARHKGTDAGGNAHGACAQLGAGAGANQKISIGLRCQLRHLLVQVPVRRKRRNLLQQALHQFVSGADRKTRDVVERFVAVQLGALAAGMRQRVDKMGAQTLQAQLKGLEQAHRASANDYDIGINCRRGVGDAHDPGLSVAGL